MRRKVIFILAALLLLSGCSAKNDAGAKSLGSETATVYSETESENGRVYLTVNSGKDIDKVTVKTESGEEIPVEGSGGYYWYEKPEGEVTVDVKQKDEPAPYAAGAVKTDDGKTGYSGGDGFSVDIVACASGESEYGCFEALIKYDAEKLALVSAEPADSAFAINTAYGENTIKLAYAGAGRQIDEKGVQLVKLYFSVKDGAEAGDADVSLAAASFAPVGASGYETTGITASVRIPVGS